MSAIVVVAIDSNHRLHALTELLPAAAAMIAGCVALIVVHHDTLEIRVCSAGTAASTAQTMPARLMPGNRCTINERRHV